MTPSSGMWEESFYRRVIRICAEDSPNVRNPNDPFPGLLTGEELDHRRATWNKVRQTVGLDARFYEGAELLLFPQEWLNRAAQAEMARRCLGSPAEAVGIDPGEGGANTAMAAVNRWGLKELVSHKTPNTAAITAEAKAFVKKHGVPWRSVVFDRGGGGKQHADRLTEEGCKGVSSVAFGSHPELEMKRGLHMLEARKQVHEQAYEYVNLRAQMYHELSQLLDPAGWVSGFPTVMESVEGIQATREGQEVWGVIAGLAGNPAAGGRVPGETEEEYQNRRLRLATTKVLTNVGFYVCGGTDSPACPYTELNRQLSVIPKLTDQEGRYWMLPKQVKDKSSPAAATQMTLEKLIGHSPDEADAVVLAVHRLLHRSYRAKAGAA